MNSIDGRITPTINGWKKFDNGGKGSGNFGHSGRPGKVGGSGKGKGSEGGTTSKGEPMPLASFMRLAKDTPLEFKQVSFYGGDPRHPDWRGVEKVQTKAIKLGDSWLDLPKASLVEIEWDGENGTMKCYDAGTRDLDDKEKEALAEWKKITETPEYQQKAEMDMMTDTSMTYWQEKAFWEDKGMRYMFHEYSQGKKRVPNYDKRDAQGKPTDEIRDDSIKGKLWAEYEFRRKA